ncbi:malto-oligosyltrehalose trehalohydrolase [Aciditerrimonas ferrireducens]|uniref:Malto-oligosyltrehalose trehalohydrolase n=1 Tax=Aciditerrimonas ferrireducens TaxID=667306 RepID=A0ABV6C5N9_9ACTN
MPEPAAPSHHAARRPLVDPTSLPGAVPLAADAWRFEVWAPRAEQLAVQVVSGARAGQVLALAPLAHDPSRSVGGRFGGVAEGLAHGDRYWLLVDGEPLADPASRWQPEGVFGPSALVDPARLARGTRPFRPPPLARSVLYEVHVGTATPDGTFAALIGQLDRLVDLGVTTLELMPVCEFPGRWNWGYDGVFPYAAQSTYGGPEGLAELVRACHERDLAVVLDLVQNHFGPEGCVLPRFGPYTTDRYRTPWGPAVNVEGWGADEVRRFLLGSALWWLEALDVDGFRMDAIHGIVDPTARPYLAELTDAVADVGRRTGRPRLVVAESADNDPRVLAPTDQRGLGMDGQWHDDVHHALHALLTGERQGYYEDFGAPEQLARALLGQFVLDGRFSRFRGRRHGAPLVDVDAARLVCYAQNHDQVGNRPRADRLTTLLAPELVELACVLVALGPGTPLLFMGEEYGETRPFPFFVDHRDPALLEAVRRGRAEELGADPVALGLDPADPATRARAVLDPSVVGSPPHDRRLALWQTLLHVRRTHPALAPGGTCRATWQGDTLLVRREHGEALVVLCWRIQPGEVVVEPAPDLGPGRWRVLAGSAFPLGADVDAGGIGPRAELPLDERGLTVPGPGWLLVDREAPADRPVPPGADQ